MMLLWPFTVLESSDADNEMPATDLDLLVRPLVFIQRRKSLTWIMPTTSSSVSR